MLPSMSNILPPFAPWNDTNSNNMIYNRQPRPLMSIAPTIPRGIEMNDRLKRIANYEPYQPDEFESFKKILQRNLQNAISQSFDRG